MSASRVKSRDGIPLPMLPPPGLVLGDEARIARRRAYPVTVVYTAYAIAVLVLALRDRPLTALVFTGAGIASWTLIEYLVHRFVLHGAFPDDPNWLRHQFHVRFDASHLNHHERPWDGKHINGRFDTAPFAAVLAALAFLAPLPTGPVFVATLLQCYVIEEWIHYAVHFHRFDNRYFKYIRRHHLHHHGRRGRDSSFGLTSGLWDGPLGTARKRSPHEARSRSAPLEANQAATTPIAIEHGQREDWSRP